MKKFYCFLLALLSVSAASTAQDKQSLSAYRKSFITDPPSAATGNENGPATNSVGYSGTGSNIDVTYHRINWTIDPNDASKTVTGSVVTYFKTTVANVSAISFDLNKASFNNGSLSVTYHGTTCTKSFPSSAPVNILNITLPVTITTAGTLDSVVINYSGAPPGVSGAAEGYQRGSHKDQSNVTRFYTMSLSESYEDRDWWPCKADMQDKIDKMDINVTVPWTGVDTFWVAANGKLYDSTITGSTRTFRFHTDYPTPSYLVAVSVARFNRYYRVVDIGGTPVQVAYYLLAGKSASSYTTITTAMDKINLVLAAFSSKFGDYPFKNEKHGFYDGLLGAGGMEHQTFSGIATSAISDLGTLAHELMHQWFGDNVSFATWNDLWLAEGFARYSEAFCGEVVPSLGIDPLAARQSIKSAALGYTAASAWIPNANIATSDLIWNSSYGGTVYDRGAMIVSMLRTLCGDAIYFSTMKNYQTTLAGKSASTDVLKSYFNASLGTDISAFFDDYVGGSGTGAIRGGVGNPIHSVKWNSPGAKRLLLSIGTQSQTAGSNVSYFHGPILLHVTGASAGMDTSIVIYDWGGGKISTAGNGLGPQTGILSYNLSFTPTTIALDDSAKTMSTGSATKLATLAAEEINFSAKKASSNSNEVDLSVVTNNTITKVDLLKSKDGAIFSAAGQMNNTGSNNQTFNYKAIDNSPYDPVTYYRAKVYANGDESLSTVVKVISGGSKGVDITPSPASNNITVSFSNTAHDKVAIRIIGMDGKVLTELTTNENFSRIDVSKLPSATYILQIIKEGVAAETGRFMVNH